MARRNVEIVEIRYEDLVSEPAATVSRVCD
ncbi:MAG: sulfotransferase [Proteobacteria bacterium]|nr:sulfotransferase [Pseudomonadota bacterium]